jgi:hypothetical protein
MFCWMGHWPILGTDADEDRDDFVSVSHE